jgi:hypothetical protein
MLDSSRYRLPRAGGGSNLGLQLGRGRGRGNDSTNVGRWEEPLMTPISNAAESPVISRIELFGLADEGTDPRANRKRSAVSHESAVNHLQAVETDQERFKKFVKLDPDRQTQSDLQSRMRDTDEPGYFDSSSEAGNRVLPGMAIKRGVCQPEMIG